MNKLSITTLFLQQTVADSEADFNSSIVNENFPRWDAVIITASNKSQAEGYKKQIEYRQSLNRLPSKTAFLVIPDKNDKRIGSAGSTFSVIRELKKRYGDLHGKRFLCIHAGGDSKRCPQYSALGKLFSPLPTLINGKPATLFDMFMVSMASIPGRLGQGMLLLSGDVVLLFNPLMCDFGSSDASVISFKEDVETGKDHGVYLPSDTGNVKKFLHKQSVEKLNEMGAIDGRGYCNIDTGAIELSPKILDKLYSLVDTTAKYKEMVNEKVRLSLYGDIAYCLAEDSTLQEFYNEQPEGKFCPELKKARKKLWDAISKYNMKLLTLSPARFIHFGSIPEIMALMKEGIKSYERLGWNNQINSSISNSDVGGYNSVLSSKATIGSGCFLEVSYVHSTATVGNNCYLSFVDVHNVTIPDNVLLHGLKQKDDKFVCRIFGIDDNPKSTKLFGVELEDVFNGLSVPFSEIWDKGEEHTLWNAKLYPVTDNIASAVKEALNLYDVINSNGNKERWLKGTRKSLRSGFNDANSCSIIEWTKRMEELVFMDEIKKLIFTRKPASLGISILNEKSLTKIQTQWLERELNNLDTTNVEDFSYALRLYYYLGIALKDVNYTGKCFKTIASSILACTMKNLKYNDSAKIVCDQTVVKLPLRVNWGGGWTDTAPYCIENGGVVLNAAISLNGELPVEVKLVKIPEKKIIFDSRDMDVHGEFTTIKPLQKTGDPFDPFALQKACLLACGIIPKAGGNLEEILTRLGGGFEMHSEVTNVPKGSGLGTSSILSAAAVKATLQFIGQPFNDDILCSTVMAMEQIMSTGGGWQDQVGGITNGIKYVTSPKGIYQELTIEKIELKERFKNELNNRFAIIYTGQRRLARNLLRDVVGRYVGNNPESISALNEIKTVATLMRSALIEGDINSFCKLLNEHWEYSKKIDANCNNTLIEQIFMSIEDLIDAKMICGAGGGGFLQVILKKGVSKTQLHNRLKEVFQDFAVDVWQTQLVF